MEGFTSYLMIGTCFILFAQTCTPIRVDFGTKKGPIEPPTSTRAPALEPRALLTAPAPVFEYRTNDVPNPTPYRPFVPYQYRNKVRASFEKAPVSIYFGTEYDQKYSQQLPVETIRKIARFNALANRNYASAQKVGNPVISHRSLDTIPSPPTAATQPATTTTTNTGLNYRGPQTFGPEHNDANQTHYTIHYFASQNNGRGVDVNLEQGIVPQFGVIYLAGVPHYVPRLQDFSTSGKQNAGVDDRENSVYDKYDLKYHKKY